MSNRNLSINSRKLLSLRTKLATQQRVMDELPKDYRPNSRYDLQRRRINATKTQIRHEQNRLLQIQRREQSDIDAMVEAQNQRDMDAAELAANLRVERAAEMDADDYDNPDLYS